METSRRTLERTFLHCPAVWIAATLILLAPSFASAKELTYDYARAIITPFYDAMNRPTAKNIDEILRHSTSSEWVGCTDSKSCLSRDRIVARLQERGKAIPDFAWIIQDIIVSNNTVVVRGEVTGTPVSPFMGLPVTGKHFRIMSVDIHIIENGKIVRTHYIKDWTSAAQQLGRKQIAVSETPKAIVAGK